MEEVVITIARCPGDSWPQPIFSGNPPEPIECSWLAISRVDDGPSADPETFALYFLTAKGVLQEVLRYGTLEIAMDQAHAITGIPRDHWRPCAAAVGDGTEVLSVDSLRRCYDGVAIQPADSTDRPSAGR